MRSRAVSAHLAVGQIFLCFTLHFLSFALHQQLDRFGFTLLNFTLDLAVGQIWVFFTLYLLSFTLDLAVGQTWVCFTSIYIYFNLL